MRAKSVIKYLFIILALSTTFCSDAMVFSVEGDGKWTNQANWDGAFPGKTNFLGDTIVIDAFITLNTDITIEGVVLVTETGSLLGNKQIEISPTGTLINEGNSIVKKIVNNGLIVNRLILECTGDLLNYNTIKNYETVLVGSSIYNTGAINGDGGQYFSGEVLINQLKGSLSGNIDICAATNVANFGKLDSTSISMCGYHMVKSATLMAFADGEGITLRLLSPNVSNFSHARILRSTDGEDYYLADVISDDQIKKINHEAIHLFQDEFLFDEGFIYYKVTVVDIDGRQSELPTVAVSKPKRTDNEFASAN